MKIQLPDSVRKAINLIENAEFEAYAVGGSVRDTILGKEPLDWDITTSALPSDLLNIFADFKLIETGIKHGTVTVIIDDTALEITTFRLDGEYSDNRHPDSVTFTSDLTDDLSRRDFTVNAMAYNDRVGLVDEFGGQDDIKNRLIKCVGDPDTRFNEDALRILRALRFASVLDFEIDPATSQSILKNRELLKNVAIERINVEFTKLLCGKNVEQILLEYKDVFAVFIPELRQMFGFNHQNPNHVYDVWEHTVHTVSLIPPKPYLRVTMLLHDIGKPKAFTLDENGVGRFAGHAEIGAEIAAVVVKNLRYSNSMQKTVINLVLNHDKLKTFTKPFMKNMLNKLGESTLYDLFDILYADISSLAPSCFHRLSEVTQLRELLDEIIQENECFSLKDLAINGKNLLDAKICEGESIGITLDMLLQSVIDGKCENEFAALIDLATKFNNMEE